MHMYSDAVIRHALDREHAGSAGEGAVHGEAGDTGCGDELRIELVADDGRVVRARHRSFACPHATAAAALACRLAEGRDLLDAARIGASALEDELRPAEHNRECVALAADALHGAIARALAAGSLPAVEDRVAVAMSGGVDSAVALLKAVEAGLRGWRHAAALDRSAWRPDFRRACCSPAVRAAPPAATCHRRGRAARHARPARALPERSSIRTCAITRPARRPIPASAATAASG